MKERNRTWLDCLEIASCTVISLIRDKFVTTQNLEFFSYCYRKKRLKMRFLTGIVWQRSLQNSPLESSRVFVALVVNHSCFLWRCGPTLAIASSFVRFLDHTQWRTTVGRTPLDEWSARRRELYLTTHNTRNRKTSMPPVGFEPTFSVGELPHN